jgi:hypothetical protein
VIESRLLGGLNFEGSRILDAASRESQVPTHELESWKRIFLEQGTRGLKTRSDPEQRELTLASAKLGS